MGRQGRLSRHKVTVGEPAVGSPPINYKRNSLVSFELPQNTERQFLIASSKIERKNYYTTKNYNQIIVFTYHLILSQIKKQII